MHTVWILSELYRILTYFLFFSIITITTYMLLFKSAYTVPLNPSCFLFFASHNAFVVRKTGRTTNIHSCCLIIFHTPPKIRANVASLWFTYTNVSALYWYSYYCGLVYRIYIILSTIQGDCFNFLHLVKRFMWYHSVLTQYSYYHDLFCLWPE